MILMNNNAKQIRVLQIAGGLRDNVNGKPVVGGIVSFLYNYYSKMNHDRIHFDFLAIRNQCFEQYRNDFERLGSDLYALGIETGGLRRFVAIIRQLSSFIKEHDYDAVHINTSAFFPALACAIAAKKAGIKNIIAHSHSTGINSKLQRIAINLLSPLLTIYADQYCACSFEAAKNLFSRGVIKKKKYKIIRNAIDAAKYKFNMNLRDDVRTGLGYENEFVIGHVGRFVDVKNHEFLVEFFLHFKKSVHSAKLMLIGDGELEQNIKDKVDALGLTEDVDFLGYRNDPYNYYQAMDLFVMPSFVEGFPIVALEAQASGLPCYLSSSITNEVVITDWCWSFALDDGPNNLAETVNLNLDIFSSRKDTSQCVVDAGFDIKHNLETLESLYVTARM